MVREAERSNFRPILQRFQKVEILTNMRLLQFFVDELRLFSCFVDEIMVFAEYMSEYSSAGDEK